jgi:hypothetical protein
MKFKINQPLILHESLKDADWYKPGIFYFKKIHPVGTLPGFSQNKDGTNIHELIECHNAYGEKLICHKSKFIPAPIHEVREEKINILLKDNLF